MEVIEPALIDTFNSLSEEVHKGVGSPVSCKGSVWYKYDIKG